MLIYKNEKGENIIEEDQNVSYVRRFLKNSFHQSEFAEKFYPENAVRPRTSGRGYKACRCSFLF